MANRYGEAALMAVRMETYGKALTPMDRWDDAVKKLYPTAIPAQKRSSPRAAFLGLCEAGLVKGIEPTPSGAASSSANANKLYAQRAAALLAAGTHKTVSQLWSAVTEGSATEHSNQMDVVLALWKNGLIISP